MKVKIQQFLFGKSHSWSVVGREIGRSLISNGDSVDFVSTDGIDEKFVPEDLKKHIKLIPDREYDCQISYTAPINFNQYLSSGNKNRFAIHNYEWPILPKSFARHICSKTVDKFLPSSPFFYDICIKNNIPAEKMEIIPHGINSEKFLNAKPMQLNTNKKIKLFINVAQVHLRKNLEGTLNVFGGSFNKNDDICLVIKTTNHKPTMQFEQSFNDVYNKFHKKYPNHAECLILKDYIPNIEELYAAIDILFMLPHTECFFLPALEALASKKLIITSNYGGPISYAGKDSFLNNNNSFLISGKEVRCPKEHQYWEPSVMNSHWLPNYIEASDVLVNCVKNFELEKQKKLPFMTNEIIKKHDWNVITSDILKLCN